MLAKPMTPQEVEACVLYRDALMLVLNKPAGMPVHFGKNGGEYFEKYFEHLRFGLPHPPALAHRLDKVTSGCLILGRHRQALATLGELFLQQKIQKVYWAIVQGEVPEDRGTMDIPMRKREPDKPYRWMMMAAPDGLPAITDYEVIARIDGKTWLALMPRTGRTHQLRVHCAAFGYPIIGDDKYGGAALGSDLMLHARSISVPLYKNKPPVKITAPPPEHMAAFCVT